MTDTTSLKGKANVMGLAVPIGAAILVMVAVVGSALALQKTLLDVNNSVDRLDRSVTELTRKVDGGWTRRDMEQWASMLQAMNVGKITVPELLK